ncbi:MAG: class I SAM-dependent methyltransferase [Patescibacteria group bacterium]
MKINQNTSKFWGNKIFEQFTTIIKSPIYKHKLKLVFNEIKNGKGNILDVGVGYGFIEDLIVKNNLNFNMSGLDISKQIIINANKKYRGKFIVGNITKIKFIDNQFDYVLALDILEHLSSEELNKGLGEIYRIMKSNGKLIISVPLNENDHDSKQNHHIQKFNLEKIIKTLKKSNFLVTKKYELISYKKYYFLKNVINRIVKLSKPNLLILICKKE